MGTFVRSVQILERSSIDILTVGDSQKVYGSVIECVDEAIDLLHFYPPDVFIALKFLDFERRMENVFGKKFGKIPALLLDLIGEFRQIFCEGLGSMDIAFI